MTGEVSLHHTTSLTARCLHGDTVFTPRTPLFTPLPGGGTRVPRGARLGGRASLQRPVRRERPLPHLPVRGARLAYFLFSHALTYLLTDLLALLACRWYCNRSRAVPNFLAGLRTDEHVIGNEQGGKRV